MKKGMYSILGAVVAVSLLSAIPAWAKPIDQQVRHGRQVQSISIKKIPSEITKAVQNLYKILPDLKELRVTKADIWEGEEGASEWSFSLSNRSKSESNEVVRAHVTIDGETGLLLFYSINHSGWSQEKPLSEKEAKEIGDKFLKNAMGDKSDRYQLVKNDNESEKEYDEPEDVEQSSRTLTYRLTVNNIPVRGTDIMLQIDGDGHITFYENYSGSDIPDSSLFPNPTKAISKKKADAAYLDVLDMQLSYNANQLIEGKDENKEIGPVLKYMPSYIGSIDAFTGKKVYGVYAGDEEDEGPIKPEKIKPEKIKLAPEGKEIVIKSVAEAQQVLEKGLNIDLANAEYRESGNKKIRSYEWMNEEEDYESSTRVTTDAKTGKLLSVDYRNDNDESDETRLKLEEAKAAAVKQLEKWLPQEVDEVILAKGWASQASYSFNFQPLYQGVPVESSAYAVNFDGEGNITRLRINLKTDFSALPENMKTISAKNAAKAYMKKNPFTLTYVLDKAIIDKGPKEVKLHYVPANDTKDSFVDAFTGEYHSSW